MADEALASPPVRATQSRWAVCKRFAFGVSLSRVQAVVGTAAGVVSVTGALFSLVQFARPANTGELVAIVQEAASRRSVTDATVEVLTTDNALVATLTPDSTGRATQKLREGVYVVRVSHPRFAAEVRRIQVVPRQTVQIKTSLHAGSSTTVERAVKDGMRAIGRAFKF